MEDKEAAAERSLSGRITMRYENISEGIFLSRPNRFIANVLVNGKEETVHVKNTGRCRELLLPGAKVWLERSSNPARKTAYDLFGVYKPGLGFVNMDSQAPNKAVLEWLKAQPEITSIKPEFTYGKSRIDFFFTKCSQSQPFGREAAAYSTAAFGSSFTGKAPSSADTGNKCLMEVKGVTLERDGIAYFPDAPTLRGVKHIEELAAALDNGYECYLAFVIQMPGIREVRPNDETHPAFGEALRAAQRKGVHILALSCCLEPEFMEISGCHELLHLT